MAEGKKRVFLIEDDPFMVSLLYEALSREGFEVISAADGEQAVAEFPNARADVLIVDILLPKKNGIEALREIRTLPGGNIPALILSNLEDANYMRDAEELGVKAYLVKANLQLPEIVSKIKEAVKS